MSIAWFYLMTLLAEILGTVGGFGSSVFFVPLAAFFFDFETVLGLTAVFHVASNLAKIVLFKESMDRKILMNIGVPAVVFVLIGAWLSAYMNGQYFELILGLFLMSSSVFLLIKPDFELSPTTLNARLGGAISGFAAGLLGTGGAIRGLTLAAFQIEKNIFVATSAAIDMGVDVSRTVVYSLNDFIPIKLLWMVPVLLAISFLGSYAGKRILNHVSQAQFKTFSLYLIAFIGVFTVVRFLYLNH